MNKKNYWIKILFLSIIVMSMVLFTQSFHVYAGTDLPIDIDYQIEGMGTRAVTVSRGIDLFSERSREVTDTINNQREAIREEAFEGLFNPLYQVEELRGEERLLEHVTSNALFSDGVNFRERDDNDDGGGAGGESVLLLVTLMMICGICGFIIAMLSMRKKKG